jgi:hypothetical protein
MRIGRKMARIIGGTKDTYCFSFSVFDIEEQSSLFTDFEIPEPVASILMNTIDKWLFLSVSITTRDGVGLVMKCVTYDDINGLKSVSRYVQAKYPAYQNTPLNISVGYGIETQGNSGNSFTGYIDNIRIYNVALVDAQLQLIINNDNN